MEFTVSRFTQISRKKVQLIIMQGLIESNGLNDHNTRCGDISNLIVF